MQKIGQQLSRPVKGMLLAIFASSSWGFSGALQQFVSQTETIPAGWFLSARTTFTGLILLTVCAVIYRGKIFNVFKSWRSIAWLIAYGLLGLAANMGSFYVAIQQGGANGASSATILQYLAPLFILLGAFLFQHKKPLKIDLIVFLIALLGVFLSVTRGNIHELSIPMISLVMGIVSGITAACYVVLPKEIGRDNPPMVILGWGTLIASVAFNLHQPVWVDVPHLSTGGILGIAGIIFFGTILTFPSVIYATRYTDSATISLIDAIQPVITFVISIFWFQADISWPEIIGAVLIIVAIYILQAAQRHPERLNNKSSGEV
ncbi:DMT family transporter [Fructilactobacillus florum]|uniref:DMT family transporter n=1 Tax=Fructilactobacillus florum TaxID=640331 RepID=UPI00028DE9F7|nr:DMT family transporter [Fructilactobacillus florum]EKK20141.1 Permease of the drug, metabolite transporter (DMT) superfamily [Fructilactobacillus florum 2F]